ncbi:MAG: hypothetical protein MUE94_14230 [Verrucomicrobia bacterium]|nr:hypothetical protein [Verrucomicrobiota bacterium]
MIHRRTKAGRVAAQCLSSLGVVLLAWTTALGQTPTPDVVPVPLDEVAPADEAGSPDADHHTTARRLRVITDPTVIGRRLWLETEWDEYKDGTRSVEETLGAVWAWSVSTNHDWAVRLKLPYEWRQVSGPRDTSTEDGLGDFKLAVGGARRLSQAWRAAASLELRMPTAEDDLGGRDWRLQEFGAVAWTVARSVSLSPSFEYNQSLAEVDDGHPQHYLELFFPATLVLPRHWSLSARYEAKLDFEKNNNLTQSVRLQVAKQLTHPPLGFSLAVKKPFDNGALAGGGLKEFQVNFMVTYFLR